LFEFDADSWLSSILGYGLKTLPKDQGINMYQLKISVDTILKMRPLQSSILPDEEEYPIEDGTLFNLHSFAPIEDHIKVAFLDQSFKGRNTWYVHRAFAQVLKDGEPILMDGKQLRVAQDTVLKIKPIQSSQLAEADKKSAQAGELFNIHSFAVEDNHIRVMSFGQFEGENTWYIYLPHAEIFEDGEPIPLGSKKLTEQDYQQAAALLNVDVPAIKAVVRVETSGGGFFKDDRPKILFEAHWFGKYTGYRFNSSHPNISGRKWDSSKYVGGAREYQRLETAKSLDETAALKSASWGLGQIMGGNHKAAGYPNVHSFVKDMYISEGKQLIAMVNFIKSQHLDRALRQHNWHAFARGYNGPGYRRNNYHTKLANAYAYYRSVG
jgi:hypothetical protein